jgi:two-component system, OmpR family, phosphate regulon response regulator OmpR
VKVFGFPAGAAFHPSRRFAEADTGAPRPATKRPEPEDAAARVSGRILCVEDNSDMLMLLKDLLEWDGCFVGEAQTLGVARKRLAAEAYDLVLLDLMLPDGDGLDLLSELRAADRTKALPVIILSGRGDDETIQEGFRRGAQGYLVKTISFDRILDSVHTYLKRPDSGPGNRGPLD